VIETERKEAGDLIEGIKRDAEAEVATIREETERYAAQRRDSAAEQAAAILREAEVKAEAQAQAVIKNAESKASVERKKYALQVKDRVIQETMDLARAKCAELTGSPDYRRILRDWIVEAAVGLSVDRAVVNASKEELPLVTAELLREAADAVESITGKRMEMTVAENDPLPAQGVVLTAAGGRLAYNNQVPTRFLRSQTVIRKLIYSTLFDENDAESRKV